MLNPLISIIVPVYNVEKYLRPCLDSILSQTYTNWEAILVDDGSKDNSGKICDEYAQKDKRFIVVHKQNEGVAQARITGFEKSKGELITFVDADDIIELDCLEKLSLPIIKDGADMVSCDYYKVEKGERKILPAKLTGTYENEQITDFIAQHYFYDKKTKGYGMTCFLWSKMVKREYVLEGLKNGLGLWFGEDQISMFTMLLQCKKLVLIPDRLYNYIQHEGQAVKRYDKSLWENIINMLSKYESLLPNRTRNEGLRMRIWLHVVRTINNKMIPSKINRDNFIEHLSYVREQAYMKEFYRPLSIGMGWKNEVRYWLLKMNFLSIYYSRYAKKR